MARVATGLDRLLAEPRALAGRRYGLLAHGASVTADWVPIHLALARQAGPPEALFGPEHGYYGVEQDMVPSEDQRDPWTGVTILVAPIAGILSDRVGSRVLMTAGLTLQAGAMALLALVSAPDVPYAQLVGPFAMAGAGMALVFAPAANAVLSSVRPQEAGQASGATNTFREIGGALGVSVLSTVFAGAGSYASPQAFTDGKIGRAHV